MLTIYNMYCRIY